MATQVQDKAYEFVAQEELPNLVAPNLSAEESAALLTCINDVRAGRKVFLVRATNRKVSNGKPRVAGRDYVADPALVPNAHEGMMTRAEVNKRGIPYFYLKDGARAPEDEPHGHTNISVAGILSFRVLREFPGPLAEPEPQPARPEPQAAPVVNPQAVMAQILMAQAQALMAQAVVMQTQAMQLWQATQNNNP